MCSLRTKVNDNNVDNYLKEMLNSKKKINPKIKALIALVGQLSLSVGCVTVLNGT